MAQINNSQVTKRVVDLANIQISRENPPTQLADKIVPVIECSPFPIIKTFANVTYTTSQNNTTIFTSNANKDTFLTKIQFNNMQTALSDNTLCAIDCTNFDGESVQLLRKTKFTTTAVDDWLQIDFNRPIKLKRGSIVQISLVFTAGASSTGIVIQGFEQGINQ